jgi:hypothetical protein
MPVTAQVELVLFGVLEVVLGEGELGAGVAAGVVVVLEPEPDEPDPPSDELPLELPESLLVLDDPLSAVVADDDAAVLELEPLRLSVL